MSHGATPPKRATDGGKREGTPEGVASSCRRRSASGPSSARPIVGAEQADEPTADEPTIDELLDDESWIGELGSLSCGRGHFDERVPLAREVPTEELISPDLIFPSDRDDKDDGDGAPHHAGTPDRRCG